MTTWGEMSNTRRGYMVYKTVHHVQPEATFERICEYLRTVYEADITEQFVQDRLQKFKKRRYLTVKIVRKTNSIYWFPTGLAEAETRKT
jgi:hypothetical protein